MANVRRLPVPVAETWEWQLRAACRNLDSALFFQPEGERGPAKAAREAGAKQICRRCPVLEQCRRHALAVGEPYGVWGGMSMAERSALLRGMPSLRPGATVAGLAAPTAPAGGGRPPSGRARDRQV